MFILGCHGTSAQACKQPNTCPNTLACNYEMVIYVVGFSPKRNFCYVLILVAQIPLAAAHVASAHMSILAAGAETNRRCSLACQG
jgi:hypothetical protein